VLVFDQEKLNIVLEEIAEGFTRSPLEIALFFVLVIVIVLTAALLGRRQLIRLREQKYRVSQHRFENIVRKQNLGSADSALLESMAVFLASPDLKYRLVENQGVFNMCAEKLLESGIAASTEIAALRLHLGFGSRNPEQPIRSTAQLYEDLPVLVVQKNRRGCRGLVVMVEPYFIGIETDGVSNSLETDAPVRIYFQIPSGRFMFNSRICSIEKNSVEVMHSEHIKRLQRRTFYRKKFMIPVYVKRVDVKESPMLTTLIDLGGGGASIARGNIILKTGDRIRIRVYSVAKERIDVTATVLRFSKGNRITHIRFDNIRESDRDRIINMLLLPMKK